MFFLIIRPLPLETKLDWPDVSKRWDAFWKDEVPKDRVLMGIYVLNQKNPYPKPEWPNDLEKFHTDLDFFIKRRLHDNLMKKYWIFLCPMAQVNDMELQEAYQILNEMMKSFEIWFPIEESDAKEDIEIYKERFAATKLCLELGEYTREDYDYLFFVHDMVIHNIKYYKAIGVFIGALSEEYGWI